MRTQIQVIRRRHPDTSHISNALIIIKLKEVIKTKFWNQSLKKTLTRE